MERYGEESLLENGYLSAQLLQCRNQGEQIRQFDGSQLLRGGLAAAIDPDAPNAKLRRRDDVVIIAARDMHPVLVDWLVLLTETAKVVERGFVGAHIFGGDDVIKDN